MPGELAAYDKNGLPKEDRFRIKVFNVVIDKLCWSIKTRFVNQKNPCLGLLCFNPRRFSELNEAYQQTHSIKYTSYYQTLAKESWLKSYILLYKNGLKLSQCWRMKLIKTQKMKWIQKVTYQMNKLKKMKKIKVYQKHESCSHAKTVRQFMNTICKFFSIQSLVKISAYNTFNLNKLWTSFFKA